MGVITSWPFPLRWVLTVASVIVSISPVPKIAPCPWLYIQADPTFDPAGPSNESFHTRVQGWPGEVLMVACEFELADAEEDEGDGGDEEEHAARLAATAIPRLATMVRDSRKTLARNSLPRVTDNR